MAEETKVNENVNFDGAYGYWHLREDGVLEWITADSHVQLTDLLFAPGFIKIDAVSGKVVDNGLSPNPDGSGYVKQVNTSALSNVVNPEENVLYVVGDRKFKYLKTDIVDPGTNKIIIPHGFNRVFAIPSVAQVKGVHGTPRKENVTPKEIPQVFPHPVAFLKEVYVKGKKLEDYIDAQGGVTEEELQAALAAYLKKTDGAVIWNAAIGGGTLELSGDAKLGDIVRDSNLFFIIKSITKSGNSITAATFYPLAGTNRIWTYSSGVWSHTDISSGTQLYRHRLYAMNNDDTIEFEIVFISTESTQYLMTNIDDLFPSANDKIVSVLAAREEVEGDRYIGASLTISLIDGIAIDGYSTNNEGYDGHSISVADLNSLSDTVTAL